MVSHGLSHPYISLYDQNVAFFTDISQTDTNFPPKSVYSLAWSVIFNPRVIQQCNFSKREGAYISLSESYQGWRFVIPWTRWRIFTYQEIWRERHPKPYTGQEVSHRSVNCTEHFDLEVTTFSRFYLLVCKNGGELPKYKKNHAILVHPNRAWRCKAKAHTCRTGKAEQQDIFHEILSF